MRLTSQDEARYEATNTHFAKLATSAGIPAERIDDALTALAIAIGRTVPRDAISIDARGLQFFKRWIAEQQKEQAR